jgi:pimeloyl-ACP methyl ester carboxylesterase
MNSIAVNLLGCEVRYRGRKFSTRTIEAGTGKPLILIHGIGGHAEAYSRNLKRLGAERRAIAIDLLWHGFSSKPPLRLPMIPAFGEQVIDLLDSLEIERAAIEGESLGGWVTLWLARNHPERLDKIILNTTAGVRFDTGAVKEDEAGGIRALRDRSIAALSNPTPETVRRRLEWLMASPDRVTNDLVEVRHAIYNTPEIQSSLLRLFEAAFTPDGDERFDESMLAQIDVPTLVFWADKNPGVGADGGERLAASIPHAQYYCAADAAHWPQWEKPEEHDRVVLDFLRSDAMPTVAAAARDVKESVG